MNKPASGKTKKSRGRRPLSRQSAGAKSSPDRHQRWDEIIHEAAEIFYEKGYEATSLQDIADAVGLLKGSIYYYIDSKEDLLFELVMRTQTIWKEVLVESDELAASPAPIRLREFILRFMQLKDREREWGIVAEREFMRLSPEYLSQVMTGRKQFSAFVEGIVEQGLADGDFDQSLDLSLASGMVFELIKASHLSRRPKTSPTLVELSDSYSLFVMRGLGAVDWEPPSRG